MEIKEDDLHESMEITGTLPDGTVLHYEVAGVFALDESRQYMVLHPWNHENSSLAEIAPFGEGKDGEVVFRDFADEEEYQQALAAFNELLQEADEDVEGDMEDE